MRSAAAGATLIDHWSVDSVVESCHGSTVEWVGIAPVCRATRHRRGMRQYALNEPQPTVAAREFLKLQDERRLSPLLWARNRSTEQRKERRRRRSKALVEAKYNRVSLSRSRPAHCLANTEHSGSPRSVEYDCG